ncbi:hypothetical protein Arub01_37320 [Actinomadura rubrobrunea]|uniref:Uncharacterized protein n=1 Tax=Actinomadura rubrobrunea TaxID=115335 RepID=A0A9W6PYU9_9ACTN|nr:hypothetical protein Arub01_37320 [Actinomadura rubrobrunea]
MLTWDIGGRTGPMLPGAARRPSHRPPDRAFFKRRQLRRLAGASGAPKTGHRPTPGGGGRYLLIGFGLAFVEADTYWPQDHWGALIHPGQRVPENQPHESPPSHCPPA